MLPHLDYETKLWMEGYKNVIGVDEVGRGAFAGPLCVAGVIFKPCQDDKKRLIYLLNLGINDSKKLTAKKRELLSNIIQKECFSYYISTIQVTEIDRIGVGHATFAGMREVVKNLCEKGKSGNNFLLTDAFKLDHAPEILERQFNIIRGDSKSLSIAAASIIAKVYRDKLMEGYSNDYPEYGLSENKGYGTLSHRQALKKYGTTDLHRIMFVKNYLR